MDNRFLFVVPVYQSEKYISKCIESIQSQTYQNWRACVIIDPSTDKTKEIAENLCSKDNRFSFSYDGKRRMSLGNRLQAIKLLRPENEDVLVFLDGDDWLFDNTCLEYLNAIYQNEQVWTTWGSYITYPKMERGGASLPVQDRKSIRNIPWCFSHLKTAKYFLWKNIRSVDLIYTKTNRIYDAANDIAYMLPMLEMAGPFHRRFIDKILMIYNYENPNNDEKIRGAACRDAAKEIKSRPSYPEKTKEELLKNGC